MTDKLIDISSNNHGNQPLDFNAAKAAGIDFVYIKAGEGVDVGGGNMYINPDLFEDYVAAKQAGLKVGLYWFYNQSFAVATQAGAFNILLQHYSDYDLVPMFDYEVGTPTQAIRDQFLSLVPKCGQYVDRDFNGQMTPNGPLWLAWPGWAGEPVNAAIVQYGSVNIPGLPNDVTDVNTVLIPAAIEMSKPVPGPAVNPPDYTDSPLPDAAGKTTLAAPCVACFALPGVDGYWLVFADGGVDGFGAHPFHGSIPGLAPPLKLQWPVIGIMAHDINGYGLVTQDGGVFGFGNFATEGTA